MMRVGLAAVDSGFRRTAMDHLRALGTSPYSCATLGELGGFAETCDVVILFSEGFDPIALRRALDALERYAAGPALIVVENPALEWTPTRPRERIAMRVARSFLEWPVAAVEASTPELPFTD